MMHVIVRWWSLVTLIMGIHNSRARMEIKLSMSKTHTQNQNFKILSLLLLALVMGEIPLATRGLGMEGLVGWAEAEIFSISYIIWSFRPSVRPSVRLCSHNSTVGNATKEIDSANCSSWSGAANKTFTAKISWPPTPHGVRKLKMDQKLLLHVTYRKLQIQVRNSTQYCSLKYFDPQTPIHLKNPKWPKN